jgi:restriction system protein
VLPTFDKFIEPILRYLASRPDGVPAAEAHEAAANALGLTEEQKQILLGSGAQPVYKNRSGWAHDRLKRAGLSRSPRRGLWCITQEGLRLVSSHPNSIPEDIIESIATRFVNRTLEELDSIRTGQDLMESARQPVSTSPEERLEAALAEIKAAVSEELLDLLSRVTPSYFETIVLDVLHRIGYGTSRIDLQRVGGTGDGGIDGVISLDRLGLEKVYVQAKRWQNTVGRPEVQAFYGALAGQRATKGVFITTSSFTSQAVEFARSVERIVLVDGERLAELMIDNEVGVSSRAIRIPRIDSDYFDE